MTPALGVLISLLLWGCIAAILYFGVAKQVQANPRNGLRLGLPPSLWVLLAALVVGAAAFGWFVIGPRL